MGRGLDTPIAIPARDREHNNVEVIMEEIDKLNMSDKRITLLSNPMRIIITTISPPEGSGLKKLPVKFLDCNEKALIKNRSEENCLYYAVILAQFHAECSEFDSRKKYKKFGQFYKNITKQKELVEQLTLKMDTKPAKSSGLDEIIQIQELLDEEYPEKFRLIIFSSDNVYLKPIWKGPRSRKYNLILYLSGNHYDVIKSVTKFFKIKKKYCFECEITYTQ